MSRPANPVRGEAELQVDGRPLLLRPSFDALVRAEEEIGSLFALAERAAAGDLRLQEIATLFWHCAAARQEVSREAVGRAVLEAGLTAATRPLRTLLTQIFGGSG
ncbi:gene transfer agent family protein [Erythrobacteraceae bacterium CFH 75059]|uniref:gene transfer agent family protein n=1 Tax=Qipengyuania thermophila TaxID=2509361 RepID=UPI001021A00C|nr:gene transfer agent family protein [Qipengyuania thermophila]TCD06845.1 gene transfer agent family protein [Erythrobacteraceae bacterium CFH 75059]